MFEQQIRILEEKFRLVDNQIFQLEKSESKDSEQLNKLKDERISYLNELRILRRKQYDHDQSIDFGDDR